jgi:hypothetical protein
MAYELHIERDSGDIGLKEWKEAVAAIDGVRLRFKDHSATNPFTQEIITVPRGDGDADVFFPESNTWRSAFLFFNGQISFKAMLLPAAINDPVWQKATALALRLNAKIRGDGGEVYDLKTGKVVAR